MELDDSVGVDWSHRGVSVPCMAVTGEVLLAVSTRACRQPGLERVRRPARPDRQSPPAIRCASSATRAWGTTKSSARYPTAPGGRCLAPELRLREPRQLPGGLRLTCSQEHVNTTQRLDIRLCVARCSILSSVPAAERPTVWTKRQTTYMFAGTCKHNARTRHSFTGFTPATACSAPIDLTCSCEHVTYVYLLRDIHFQAEAV
jgi:hypothetical protein